MSAQRHIIKRQVLELTLDKTRDAWPLQQELSRIYRQRIVPLIERYCDELSAPDRLHRIDRLELDLGPVDPDQLEAELVAKVGAALRRRLAEQISGQESAAVPPDKIPKTASQLELFSLFARQGSLPWWADLTQPRLLEDSLHYLLHHAPERLRRLLRELAGEEIPLQRLIQHYDERHLTALTTLLAPALAAFLAPLPRILTAVCQRAEELARLPPSSYDIFPLPIGEASAFGGHPKQSQFHQRLDSRTGFQGQLRRHVWHSILQVAALSEELYREPLPFCRAVLLQLAVALCLPYAALLTGLRQVLSTATTGVQSPLRDIAGTLAEELAVPAPPQREGAPAAALLDRLESLADRLPDPALRTLFPSLLSQLPEAARAQLLARLQPLFDTVSASALLAELEQWLRENQADLPPAVFDRWQAAVQQLDARATVVSVHTLPPLSGVGFWDSWAKLLQPVVPAGNAGTQLQGSKRRIAHPPWPWIPAFPAGMTKNLPQEGWGGGCERLSALQPLADRYQTDTAPVDLSFSDADELYIDNAGLVILWPFLGRFFERLGLVTENRFQDAATVQRAVGLLQYLATEDPSPPEYLLPLDKVLCGIELDQVFALESPLTEAEMAECTPLLSAVIEHAPILHNMSIPGFRGTFLLRQGILGARDGAWLLRVERETYDIVLDRFPWGMEWVKLPWMTAPLRVEW